jgi:hypothetical protein
VVGGLHERNMGVHVPVLLRLVGEGHDLLSSRGREDAQVGVLSIRILGLDCSVKGQAGVSLVSDQQAVRLHERESWRRGRCRLTVALPCAEVRSLGRERDLHDTVDGELPYDLSAIALDDRHAERGGQDGPRGRGQARSARPLASGQSSACEPQVYNATSKIIPGRSA